MPARVDPPKTATEQFRENRKLGDYTREIEDKEMHRLRKHIDASYKRLSLGSELGRKLMESEQDEAAGGSIHHAKATEFGGDVNRKARHSLDWETENSVFGSSAFGGSGGGGGRFDTNYSTPLDSHYPPPRQDFDLSPDQQRNNSTYLGDQSVQRLYNADSQSYYSPSGNKNLNNNLIPSPTSGFSKFVSDTGADSSAARQPSYSEQPDFSDLNQTPSFQSQSHRQTTYRENDDVAIVDVDDGSASPIVDVMEDVKNIKARINNLRHLMEINMSETTGTPMPTDDTMAVEPRDVSFERESAEGEQLRDASHKLYSDHRDSAQNEQRFDAGFPTGEGSRYAAGAAARNAIKVNDSPQRHSYAGYRDNADIPELPPRFSPAQYDANDRSDFMMNKPDLQFPPRPANNSAQQQKEFYRQESERQYATGNDVMADSYNDQTARDDGSQYSRQNSQRDLPQRDGLQYSRQSSMRDLPPPSIRETFSRHHDNRIEQRVSPQQQQQQQQAQPMLPHHHQQYHSPEPNQYTPQQPFRFEGLDADLPPLSTESPFRHQRSRSTGGAVGGGFGGTRDDSVLLDGSRSWHHNDSAFNQQRPKSYAGGLIGVPLTKLEKLDLETKISKSMGTLNMRDLEESAKILTGQEEDEDEERGYSDDWRQHGLMPSAQEGL